MKLKTLAMLVALVGAGASAGASTYTGGECAKADLIHRWSFNGDFKDAVTGIEAASLGRYFWDNALNPQAVKLQGGGKGTSGIDFGTGVFPVKDGAFTIEIWAAQNEVKNWARIIDINFDTANYFCLTWSQGTDGNKDRAEFKLNSAATTVDNTMCPYSLNVQYHISLTFASRADGKIDVAWAKRDVTTGAVVKSGKMTTSALCPLGKLSTWSCQLGRSPFNDNDACATYDEVRVWQKALSAEQLDWSARLGPNVLPTTEAATHETTVTASSSDAALGTVAADAGASAATVEAPTAFNHNLTLTATPAAGACFRRWVGDTDAIVEGTAQNATIGVRTQKPIALTAEFVSDAEPVFATWTAGGAAGDLADSANWTCRNQAGTVLANTCPTAKTVVTVSGATAFTCPVGSALACEAIVFTNCSFTADCDLRGLAVVPTFMGTNELNGHNLYTAKGFAGTGTLHTPYGVNTAAAQPAILANACFWLDAADVSTITKDAAGNVTKWTSKDTSHVVATAGAKKPVYTTTLVPGRPTLDFGAVGSGIDMTYTRFTKLRTVFWVIKIANSGCAAFLLGDANGGKGVFNFHRGDSAQYGNGSHGKFASIWERREPVWWSSDVPNASRFHILSATMSVDACSDSLSQDRSITDRNGGRQLSELICFNTVLSDADRIAVIDYLEKKWYPESAVAEVHVDVPAAMTAVNAGQMFTGPVRIVKEGAGAFVPTASNGLYDGGTHIVSGTMKAWTTHYPCEVQDSLTIDAAGTLDIDGMALAGGRVGASALRHLLNGGSVFNGSGSDLTPGWTMLGSLSLADDSTIRANNTFGLIGGGYRAIETWLNGHTLDIALGNGKRFYIYNTLFTNGTVRVPTTSGILDIDQTSMRGSTADFDLDCTVAMKVAGTMRNLTWRSNLTATEGTAALTVSGVFAPLGNAFPNVTLANGATLDISSKSGVWSTTSTIARTCSFTGGATITVDIHGREFAAGERVIAWTAQPSDVTFQWDAATQAKEGALAPVARADGLYYGPVETSTVAMTATWTGAAGDGNLANSANWSCTNAAGVAIADGLPGLDTAVTAALNQLPQIPAATPFNCRSFTVSGGTLGGDLDLRGLGVTPSFSGASDLAGHVLIVPGLAGTGSITNAVVEGTELVTNGSFENYTGTPKNTSWGYYGDNSLAGTSWTYSGGTGISQLNTTWVANAALPNGNWACFIQSEKRSLSQNVTVPEDGTYHLAFSFAMRPGKGPLRVNVQIDDQTIGFVNANNAAWQRDHMLVTLTKGTHKLGFTTEYATGSGDYSALLDAVSLKLLDMTKQGELRVESPAGTTSVNSGIELAGNLKLVKSGAGLLQLSKTGQTYIGGTEVTAGTLRMGAAGVNLTLGSFGSAVTVRSGATLDTFGCVDYFRYYIVLDGGRLVNTGSDLGSGTAQISHLRLTADSYIYHQDFIGSGYSSCDLELNGHALNFEDTASASVYIYNTRVFNGGKINFPNVVNLYYDKYANNSAGVSYDMNGAFHLNVDVPAKDLALRYIGNWHSGAGKIVLTGTFKPFSSYYPNVQLNNGATLDLSVLNEPLTTPSIDQRSGLFQLTYAADAKIKVATGERVLTKGDKLVSWLTIPAGITFTLDEASAENNPEPLVALADGLYYGYEPTEVVDATWSGAAGNGNIADPGNWTCLNALGSTVADGLPNDRAVVHVKGDVAMQIPSGSNLPYATLDMDGVRLTTDCDWRGFSGSINGLVNLNGHKLTVSQLAGSGTLYGSYVRINTGFMTTGESLVWKGAKLADVKNFVGTLEGAWISLHTVTGVVVGTSATTRTVQFQAWESPYSKMTEVVMTEKADGIWVKSLRSGYIQNSNIVGQYINAGNGQVATSVNGNGYGVYDLKLNVVAGASELHLDTATSAGSGVAIAGNLKFFKDGAGDYVPVRASQSYELGTEITAGSIVPGTIGTNYALGNGGSPIIIDEGAVFDFCGSYNYTVYQFQLNGGVLKNSRTTDSACQFGNTVLLADSMFKPAFDSEFWESHTMDLQGHKLTVEIGIGKTFTLGGTTTNNPPQVVIKNGVLDVTTGGWLKTLNSPIRAETASWRICCALNLGSNVYLKDYEALYTPDYNSGTNLIYVSGTFTPCSTVFHGCEMQDGSTIDISHQQFPWSTKSAFTSGANAASFADNATITIAMAGRGIPVGGKIVDWKNRTPANYDTLTFKIDPASRKRGYRLIKKVDGLYVEGGFMIFIR